MDLAAIPGLRSRRHLWKQLAVEIERAARYHRPLSVTMYDVDRLGAYNERHGRNGGDEVLAEIATILIAQTRAVDIPAYYGGGSFVLAVPEATKDQAFELAERVRRMVEFTFAPGRRSRHKVAITTSAGVSTYPDDGEDPTDLVQAAKRAVDAAKKAGRNLVVKTTEAGIQLLVPSAAGGMESVTIAVPGVARRRKPARRARKPARRARKPAKKAGKAKRATTARKAARAKRAAKARKVVRARKQAKKLTRAVRRPASTVKAKKVVRRKRAARAKRVPGKPAKKATKRVSRPAGAKKRSTATRSRTARRGSR